jgi:hypothetical protein
MIIDSKGKLFGKVSIIDILIVLVIVAAVAGVGYKFSKSRAGGPIFTNASQNIKLTFFWEEAPDFALKAVKKGDYVRDFDRSIVLGKVTDIKIDKGIFFTETDKGEIVKTSREGFDSYYMTVEGTGTFSEMGGVVIGGIEYNIGRSFVMKVGDAVFQGRIYSFEKKE